MMSTNTEILLLLQAIEIFPNSNKYIACFKRITYLKISKSKALLLLMHERNNISSELFEATPVRQ